MPGHLHQTRSYQPKVKNVFVLALLVTFVFALVEALSGWWSGSLALLGDAGHMLTDSTALMLAAIAARIARIPPSKSHTYGLGRAEILAAWISSLFMLLVIASIVIEAIERFHTPEPVASGIVMLIATLGLIINLLVAWILSHGERTLNIRAASIHVLGDILGSIAALMSGVIIYFTHWNPIDPILSIFICLLILFSTIKLLRESLLILMEGVPKQISITKVQEAIINIAEVKSVHDLHIWMLSSGTILLTAHIEIADLTNWNNIAKQINKLLSKEFGIKHITLQPELNAKICKFYTNLPCT